MTDPAFAARIAAELQGLRDAGAYKGEQVITGMQGARIRLADGRELINLCSNNYLGLASDARLLDAAAAALRSHGLGLASVRFICGAQDLHKQLEARIAAFVGTEDAVLYAAAFDANGGLFEPLLDEADAVISDELNHASIIDGIRLCKARRWRYRHDDMDDLRRCLQEARAGGARTVLVFTDGVFSMDGRIAQLAEMRTLCDEHGALRGLRSRGPHHRHLRKGAGRCFGRLHRLQPARGRAAAPALATLPLLQHTGAVAGGRGAGRARSAGALGRRRAARAGARGPLPCRAAGAGPHAHRQRPPHRVRAFQHYGAIRTALERTGRPIGVNDLHIAAHARSDGLILVSNNLAEFEQVPGLLTENSVAAAP